MPTAHRHRGLQPEQLRQPNILSIDHIKLSINGDVFGMVSTCTGKLVCK